MTGINEVSTSGVVQMGMCCVLLKVNSKTQYVVKRLHETRAESIFGGTAEMPFLNTAIRQVGQASAFIGCQNHTNGSLRRVASACSSSSSRTTVPDWPPANRNATR